MKFKFLKIINRFISSDLPLSQLFSPYHSISSAIAYLTLKFYQSFRTYLSLSLLISRYELILNTTFQIQLSFKNYFDYILSNCRDFFLSEIDQKLDSVPENLLNFLNKFLNFIRDLK